MYMYMHVYIYIYACIHVLVYLYIHVLLHICTCVFNMGTKGRLHVRAVDHVCLDHTESFLHLPLDHVMPFFQVPILLDVGSEAQNRIAPQEGVWYEPTARALLGSGVSLRCPDGSFWNAGGT